MEAQHGRHATLALVSSLALALVIVAAAVLTLSKWSARDRERAARTMAEEVAAAIALRGAPGGHSRASGDGCWPPILRGASPR